MRTEELSTAQLEWLNRQVGDACRSLNKIRQRMNETHWDADDKAFQSVTTAVNQLFAACTATHAILKSRRTPPRDYKPCSYRKQQIWKYGKMDKARDEFESGR